MSRFFSNNSRIVSMFLIIIILLFILPQIQKIYLNKVIEKNRKEIISNNELLIKTNELNNSINSYLNVYVFNIAINIGDIFLVNYFLFKLLDLLNIGWYKESTIIPKIIIFSLTTFCNFMPLWDIYRESLSMTHAFKEFLKVLPVK